VRAPHNSTGDDTMNVIIKETGETRELSIIDIKSGCDWTVDLLGNSGIHKNADTDAVTMDLDDFVWWETYINGHMATEYGIVELAMIAGVDTGEIRNDVFDYMGQQDMENERDRAVQRLEELRGELLN